MSATTVLSVPSRHLMFDRIKEARLLPAGLALVGTEILPARSQISRRKGAPVPRYDTTVPAEGKRRSSTGRARCRLIADFRDVGDEVPRVVGWQRRIRECLMDDPVPVGVVLALDVQVGPKALGADDVTEPDGRWSGASAKAQDQK